MRFLGKQNFTRRRVHEHRRKGSDLRLGGHPPTVLPQRRSRHDPQHQNQYPGITPPITERIKKYLEKHLVDLIAILDSD